MADAINEFVAHVRRIVAEARRSAVALTTPATKLPEQWMRSLRPPRKWLRQHRNLPLTCSR